MISGKSDRGELESGPGELWSSSGWRVSACGRGITAFPVVASSKSALAPNQLPAIPGLVVDRNTHAGVPSPQRIIQALSLTYRLHWLAAVTFQLALIIPRFPTLASAHVPHHGTVACLGSQCSQWPVVLDSTDS